MIAYFFLQVFGGIPGYSNAQLNYLILVDYCIVYVIRQVGLIGIQACNFEIHVLPWKKAQNG